MIREHSFTTLGEVKQKKGEVPEIGIGLLGYGFMGKAHINVYKKIPYIYKR